MTNQQGYPSTRAILIAGFILVLIVVLGVELIHAMAPNPLGAFKH